jgi:hypothetical protein
MYFSELLDFILSDALKDVPKKTEPKKSNIKITAEPTKVEKKTESDSESLSSFIDKIIFDKEKRTTVIFWLNGDKTVVHKNQFEKWDPEKSIAMATLKYLFGNKYYADIKDLIEKKSQDVVRSNKKNTKKSTSTLTKEKTENTKTTKSTTKSTETKKSAATKSSKK